MKAQHSTHLQTFISKTNAFVSRKNLTKYHNKITGELKSVFETRKKSEYPDIIETLNESLATDFQTNFKKAFEKNEENRKQFIDLKVKGCENFYKSCLVKEFKNNQFYTTTDLSKIFENHRSFVCKMFRDSFNGEAKALFDEELQNVSIFILDHNLIVHFLK